MVASIAVCTNFLSSRSTTCGCISVDKAHPNILVTHFNVYTGCGRKNSPIADPYSRQRGRPIDTRPQISVSNIPTGNNIRLQVPQGCSIPRHTNILKLKIFPKYYTCVEVEVTLRLIVSQSVWLSFNMLSIWALNVKQNLKPRLVTYNRKQYSRLPEGFTQMDKYMWSEGSQRGERGHCAVFLSVAKTPSQGL
jgi:hypothetical protein